MSTHVHIKFDTGMTQHQRDQVEEKYRLHHQEHLEELEGYDEDVEIGFCTSNRLHIEYESTNSEWQDSRLPHVLLRYFELSIVPLVFFGDDVTILFDMHDEEMAYDENDEQYCVACRTVSDRLRPADVNTTISAYQSTGV